MCERESLQRIGESERLCLIENEREREREIREGSPMGEVSLYDWSPV